MNAKPISEKNNTGCSPRAIAILGFLLFVGGLVLLWFLFIRPLSLHVQAQDWTTVKCRITHSKVEVNHDSDGSTYRPVIRYQFKANDRAWNGDTISYLIGGSSSSRRWAKGWVQKYPVGAEAACFVDPDNPEFNVLEREFSHWIWLRILPLIMVVIGALMLLRPVTQSHREKSEGMGDPSRLAAPSDDVDVFVDESSRGKSEAISEADRLDVEWDVPQKLKPATSRLGNVIGVGFFAVFWNGIVSIFVYQLLTEGFNFMSIFLGLFLIPFVLIGLVTIVGFFHQLLALFNPIVEIALSTGAVPLGSSLDIAWEVPNRSGRLKKMTILIEGKESATYVQGTNTRTDTQLFAQIPVVETTDSSEIAFGSAAIEIPPDTMHTFESSNNKIQWKVSVHGDIAWWPDISETFPFRVKPFKPS